MEKDKVLLTVSVVGTVLGMVLGYVAHDAVKSFRSQSHDPMQLLEDEYKSQCSVWDRIRVERTRELEVIRREVVSRREKLVQGFAAEESRRSAPPETIKLDRETHEKLLSRIDDEIEKLDMVIGEYKRPLKHPRAL